MNRQFSDACSLGLLITVQICVDLFRGGGGGEEEETFVQVSDYPMGKK